MVQWGNTARNMKSLSNYQEVLLYATHLMKGRFCQLSTSPMMNLDGMPVEFQHTGTVVDTGQVITLVAGQNQGGMGALRCR